MKSLCPISDDGWETKREREWRNTEIMYAIESQKDFLATFAIRFVSFAIKTSLSPKFCVFEHDFFGLSYRLLSEYLCQEHCFLSLCLSLYLAIVHSIKLFNFNGYFDCLCVDSFARLRCVHAHRTEFGRQSEWLQMNNLINFFSTPHLRKLCANTKISGWKPWEYHLHHEYFDCKKYSFSLPKTNNDIQHENNRV